MMASQHGQHFAELKGDKLARTEYLEKYQPVIDEDMINIVKELKITICRQCLCAIQLGNVLFVSL